MKYKKAISSLILGILSLIGWVIPYINFPISIIGITLGFITFNDKRYKNKKIKIRKSRGKKMALIGIITSIIGLVLSIAMLIWKLI